MKNVIDQKKVLTVEGKDEVKFFNALLKYIGITGFEIRHVNGKGNFKSKLPALVRSSGFSDVQVLAVIRDADADASGAFESIKNILKKEGLNPPSQMNQFSNGKPTIGIFIMPGNSDTGMLENLCLKTVKNDPAMECVKAFINCVSKLKEPPHNMPKAEAQAFLAAMPKIANSVGLGAQKGYWNFDSNEIADLKSFINTLR